MWGPLLYPVTIIKTQHLISTTTPIQSPSTMKLLDQNKFLSDHPPSRPTMLTQTPNLYSDDVTGDSGSIARPVLMTDEGSAFPLVCEAMGWIHILDRKNFTDQVSKSWCNLSDPNTFRDSVTEILDSSRIDVYMELMRTAKNKYRTHKAKAYLNKIELHKKQLVYCYTSGYFTAGQVSTQRSEGGMSVVKGNGTVKNFLRNATYIESLDRIGQTARKQDRDARNELKRCRLNSFMVGKRFRQNLDKSILYSMGLSYSRRRHWKVQSILSKLTRIPKYFVRWI